MTVEIISGSTSTKGMWPSWNPNLQPLDLQSDMLPTVLWRPAFTREAWWRREKKKSRAPASSAQLLPSALFCSTCGIQNHRLGSSAINERSITPSRNTIVMVSHSINRPCIDFENGQRLQMIRKSFTKPI